MAESRGEVVGRTLNTGWQSLVASGTAAEIGNTLGGGGLTLGYRTALTAIGVAVACIVTAIRVAVMRPSSTGIAGLIDRSVGTLVATGVGVAVELIPLRRLVHTPVVGMASIELVLVGSGIALALCLLQHVGKLTGPGGAGSTRAAMPPRGALVAAQGIARISDSFIFTDEIGRPVQVAVDLTDLAKLIPNLPAGAWDHHLANRDLSTWIGRSLLQPELAARIRAIEETKLGTDASKLQVLAAIELAQQDSTET